MAINFDDVVQRGGEELIQFLHYCVYSVELSPLFVFLARDYRFRPTVSGALALYDNFCAADAPARIRADAVLAPRDRRLDQMVSRLREERRLFDEAKTMGGRATEADDAGRPPVAPSPALFLFDRVVEHLRHEGAEPFDAVARAFDPARQPMENLPRGRLTAQQRAFLENVWRPRVRPQLVAAGFWQAATLGQ